MRQTADRVWQKDELVREMRASSTVIDTSLATLQNFGLVVEAEGGGFRYGPLSPTLAEFAEGAERLYREKPVAVVGAIAATPDEKLRIFAEAFRLKDRP
jgi:hypothetical protein